MTPAQAAIKFNVDRNVCALFGVDNLDHIAENFKVEVPGQNEMISDRRLAPTIPTPLPTPMQTEERFRHLPPVNAAPPSKSLLKVRPHSHRIPTVAQGRMGDWHPPLLSPSP